MFPGPENIARTLSSLRWVGSMMHEKRGEQPPTQQCTVQACALERARTGNETTIGHWPACVARRDGRRATGSLDRDVGPAFQRRPASAPDLRPTPAAPVCLPGGSFLILGPPSRLDAFPPSAATPSLLGRIETNWRAHAPILQPAPPGSRHHWRTPIRLTSAPFERTRRLHRNRQ